MIVPDHIPQIGNVPLIGQDDGGLARRQMFRDVKDRMSSAKWTSAHKMICQDCIEQNAANVRKFRSWDAVRTHLIDHHRYDHREVPE